MQETTQAQSCAIDRFEGEVAVLELPNQTFIHLPRTALPQGAKVGDWLLQLSDGSYQIDGEKTQQRKAAVAAQLAALLHRK